MDKAIVTITGIAAIAAIYRFFFGKKKEAMEVADSATITVDGGYKPNNIKIKSGKSTTLTFLRKDPNPCLEELVIPDFKIKKYLTLNEPIAITLNPTKPGITGFHCGMNMFHGRIEIV